jgi:hypothetical protein
MIYEIMIVSTPLGKSATFTFLAVITLTYGFYQRLQFHDRDVTLRQGSFEPDVIHDFD